jgi:hypothetical protein
MTMTYFQRSIADKGLVPEGIDPRHIEGYIRLQYAALSHLDWRTIRREVKLCIACIKEGGVDSAERNAQSFGL